jgi:hypothetical protein
MFAKISAHIHCQGLPGVCRVAALIIMVVLPLVGVTSGCGPLPRPFEHQSVSPLLSDQRALAPLAVQQVNGAPNLAEAVANALRREEIAAGTEISGDSFLILSGTIRSDRISPQLIWQIAESNGRLLSEIRQPFPEDSLAPPQQNAFADAAALAIVHALRGDDSGVSDIEAAPHVALRAIKAPAEFDGDSLSRAMTRALGRQGLTVASINPGFIIDGTLQIGPTINGQNLVTIEWIVRETGGRELGTVSQGSPVPHERLVGPRTSLVRDIADAGAEGILDVIQKHMRPHQSASPR